MKKSRLWYMHTLDGRPASYYEHNGYSAVSFAGGIYRVQLVPTLRQLRREQRNAMQDATGPASQWADPKRYGYAKVSFPALRQGER